MRIFWFKFFNDFVNIFVLHLLNWSMFITNHLQFVLNQFQPQMEGESHGMPPHSLQAGGVQALAPLKARATQKRPKPHRL